MGFEEEIDVNELISAYQIEALIGTGGMGWVFRARHTLAGHVVALKVMREDQVEIERAVDRMMREAAILASVSHPGIPRFYECGLLPDGRPWIAMELVEGRSLQACLDERAITFEDVIEIVANIAEVLTAVHARGFTHRDLKPDNIFLVPGDDAFPVRVIDWGIAHRLAGARYTNMNEAIGTPTYMAPEQARGGPTNGHCDVYGLGVVSYQALTGRPPFIGQTSIEILVQHLTRPVPALAPRCPDAPIGLVELVERMLIKNHEQRPSALEVRGEIDALRTRHRTTLNRRDDGASHGAGASGPRSPRSCARRGCHPSSPTCSTTRLRRRGLLPGQPSRDRPRRERDRGRRGRSRRRRHRRRRTPTTSREIACRPRRGRHRSASEARGACDSRWA